MPPRVEELLSQIQIFSDLSEHDLAAITQNAAQVRLNRGQVLLRKGDPADALYIVLSGRFQVLLEGDRVIAEVRAGEPVGEIAFFSGGTRTADVVAARDSEVLQLTRSAYEAVSRELPRIPQAILRALAGRLGAATRTAAALRPRPPRTIALCPAGPHPVPDRLVEGLREALAAHGKVALLSHDDLPSSVDACDEGAVADWLLSREEDFDRILLVVGQGDPAWDRTALRQSDGLLLVGHLGEGGAPAPPPTPLESYALGLFLPVNRTLVLWRDRTGQPISGTEGWFQGRPVNLHHHLSLGAPEDLRRLARFIEGRALGAVLAGGGALGCAHLGVMRALREAGARIDMYGGTSAGAALAVALATGKSPEEVMAGTEEMFIKRRALGRFTIPLYSLYDHTAFDRELMARYGERRLEDLPFNVYAVSTNLTSNEICIHRRGLAWTAVRASGSIPAALPPFITEEGEVLVDGALVDNLPLTQMRELKPGPNVVVTLSPDRAWRVKARYATLPAPARLARELCLGRHRAQGLPRIFEVISRSLLLSSRRTMRETRLEGDLLLLPPQVEGMGLLDWHLGRKQEEAAYHHTCRLIEQAGGFEALLEGAGQGATGEPLQRR